MGHPARESHPSAAPGDPRPFIRVGQTWARDGRSITLRVVTREAVSALDQSGRRRSLTLAELVREWDPQPPAGPAERRPAAGSDDPRGVLVSLPGRRATAGDGPAPGRFA